MRRYETIFIVRPNIAEDDIEAIVSRTTSIIEGDDGTILQLVNWGLKKLAYLIKKENQGYYIYVDYAGVPASVAEIERIFRIDDRVLKYLTVKLADTCDPEAVKEQLASAEPVPAPDDAPDAENKQPASAEPVPAPDDAPDAENKQPASAEPEPVSVSDETVKEEEEAGVVEEKQAD